jgi:hypothetical protein
MAPMLISSLRPIVASSVSTLYAILKCALNEASVCSFANAWTTLIVHVFPH